MAEIRVEQLHKAFADFVAVKDSTFTVRNGEFFCLLGPSGCGKTTTLRMIAGLELPTSGRIFLGDEDVTFKRASRRDIAFVFQLFALYPHLNVRRNIAFPLVSQGMLRSEIERRVDEAARILRIAHLLDSSVSGLSSGDRLKATTVYVTHDQMEAMAMADTIAIMNRGVIEQLGAPQDVYDRPASVFVADFIGAPAMNFIPFAGSYAAGAREVSIGGAAVGVPALAEGVAERALLCGVRPEHVRFDDASALRAEVIGIEYLGHSQIVTLTTAVGSTLRAKVDVQVDARRGERVGLAFDASAVSLFDEPTGRALALDREAAHG
jgi:multiple sugar transport system ATP-binding protein